MASSSREAGKKEFFLTFDGAPNPPGTLRILDVLKRHNVKAGFFMEGRRLEDEGGCACRVLDGGHDVGNHSYSHPNFDEISLEAVVKEVEKTGDIIHKILGIRTDLIRPPAGRVTPDVHSLLTEMDYRVVLWSYSIKDWEGPDAVSLAERVIGGIHDQAIVVFHDRVPWVPETLERIIPEIKDMGYRFERISRRRSMECCSCRE